MDYTNTTRFLHPITTKYPTAPPTTNYPSMIPVVISLSSHHVCKVIDHDPTLIVTGLCRRLVKDKGAWMPQIYQDTTAIDKTTTTTAGAVINPDVTVWYGDGYATHV